MALLVNLDAMIPREDFAIEDNKNIDTGSSGKFSGIGIRDLESGSLVLPNLRKPDFQRETNHWTPNQVFSLLKSYVDDDLIPSVILWKSPVYYFVIDGGHRLSVLRAWIEDDYGDRSISRAMFGDDIKKEQIKAAKQVRKKIDSEIGTWAEWKKNNAMIKGVPDNERIRISSAISRSLPVLWVSGNAEKAEESFYKINKQGTPLDEIEEILVRNRKKPIPIAARAIIRSGKGHKYWSCFSSDIQSQIERKAEELHDILFQPEMSSPIKTLDLPLGGSAGIRQALSILMEFILVASRDLTGKPKKIEEAPDDFSGEITVRYLNLSLKLAKRMTGNKDGSLGLHPAIYFYTASGRHSSPLFMGVATLIAKKLLNNDKDFFDGFCLARENLEKLLIENKDIVAQIVTNTRSQKRSGVISDLLEKMIININTGKEIDESSLVEMSNLTGKILIGREKKSSNTDFSDGAKSVAFIKVSLATATKCSICNGYLDPTKSVSYDHIQRKSENGSGDADNCQLTHPYCNQSTKN